MLRKSRKVAWLNRGFVARRRPPGRGLVAAVELGRLQCVAEALEGRLLLSHTTFPNPPGTPWAIPASGSATIEAENYDLGGEGVAYYDLTTANQGGAYRASEAVDIEAISGTAGAYAVDYTQAGEWMEYSVNVAASATYQVGYRLASGGKPGGTFHMNVDGVNVAGSLNVPQTSAWNVYSTIYLVGLNLTAGPHVLRLAMDSVGATGYVGNFNWMQFTAMPTSTPYSGAPVQLPGKIEAENFDNGGEGVAYHDTDTTNLGGKYRTTGVDLETTSDSSGAYDVGWIHAGEWLNYNVNVPTAGSYSADFRVASPTGGAKFHLALDGTNITPQGLTMPNTGGWQTWGDVAVTGLNLTGGQHILRVVFDQNDATGYVGNLNWLNITSAASADDLVRVGGMHTDGSETWNIGQAAIWGLSDFENLDFTNVASVPVTISNVQASSGFDASLSYGPGLHTVPTMTIAPGTSLPEACLFVRADTSTGDGGARSGVITFTASTGTQTETGSIAVQATVIGDTPDIPVLPSIGTPASPTLLQYALPTDGYADPGYYTYHYADFGTRLYEFHLAATSTLNMHLAVTASQAGVDTADFPATVDALVVADTNTNNKLDSGDLGKASISLTPVTIGTTSNGDSSPTVLAPGNYFVRMSADTQDYGGNSYPYTLTISASPTRTPFSGTPAPIPGTIEAENFDTGGEGVTYHDLTAANQGGAYRAGEAVDIEPISGAAGSYAVDYTQAGEWMEYTTNVAAGTYAVNFRVASGGKAGGTFHLNVDGVNVTGTMSVPQTSAWNVYSTVSKTGVSLTAGQHVLRLVMDSTGATGYVGNFNWMQFAPVTRPGDLDGSFGTGGKVAGLSTSTSSVGIHRVTVQNDGKLLLSGSYSDSSGTSSGPLLARYLPTGALDTTFGTGGKATKNFGSQYTGGFAAIQPDGKILVAGAIPGPVTYLIEFPITRFNGNGSIDTTFGTGGTVLTGGGENMIAGMTTQTDGKILVLENTPVGPPTSFLYRYNANGTLDTGFGNGGEVIGVSGQEEMASTINVAPDGKLVLTGLNFPSNLPWVARLNTDGSPDMSFGASGVVQGAFGTATAAFADVAVQGDGRIVATGSYNGDLILARFNTNGTFDTTFGTGGMATTHLSLSTAGQSVLLQSDGKIVVVGGEGTDGLVARYTSGGALDSTFGTGGITLVDFGTGDTLVAGALQTDGNIVAAGGTGAAARLVGNTPVPTPFAGAPIPVAQNIQVEDFDAGGQGLSFSDTSIDNQGGAYRYTPVDVEACADAGAGYDVCYARAGEWLQYTINVTTAKTYAAQVRVAAPSTGGKFHLELDGVSLGSVAVPNTGGWGTWQTISAGSRALGAGTHTLKLVMDANAANGCVANFNWVRLS